MKPFEIGSEFWQTDYLVKESNMEKWREDGKNRFYLSGRTALDAVIRDILAERPLGRIYFPSYCCHTMIEPFLRNKILVKFYSLRLEEEGIVPELEELEDESAVYLADYFGFSRKYDEKLRKFQKNGGLIIEDLTHRAFWWDREETIGDYVYCSFRKWTFLAGGAWAFKRSGAFSAERPRETCSEFLVKRYGAAWRKSRYINGEREDKQKFLALYREAEEMLEKGYRDCRADENSLKCLNQIDVKEMADRRRKNFSFLVKELEQVEELQPVFSSCREKDIPLFFPVLAGKERDGLREFLIERNIYLPVHWPLSPLHKGIKEDSRFWYEQELSLLCDQRYGEKELGIMCEQIKEYYRKRGLR